MRYVETIFDRYKDKVTYWLTFNEINSGTMPMGAVLSLGTIRDFSGPINTVPDEPQVRFQALHHQFVASAKAIVLAHEKYPQFRIPLYSFGVMPYFLLLSEELRRAFRSGGVLCADPILRPYGFLHLVPGVITNR